MKEFKLGLILTLMATTGSSSAKSRIKRGISECGSPVAAIFEITDKISENANPNKNLGGVAALFHGDVHKCGASLISRNFLLTAAHCLDFKGPMKIQLGQIDITKPPNPINTYTIKDFHEYSTKYAEGGNKYHDIALLETDDPVEYSSVIWPYCLPRKHLKLENNRLVTIAGWGLLNGGSTTSELKKANIQIKDEDDCKELLITYRQYDQFTRDYPKGMQTALLCGGGDGVDACQGDSGGPMFYKNPENVIEVIGVIASGLAVCPINPRVPGFYTNIEYYLDWINRTIQEHARLNELVYSVLGLWNAAKDGDLNYVEGAITRRIDFNWRNPDHHRATALHAAAKANNHQIVKVLLQNRADKNIRDSRGMTPLYLASWFGAKEAVNTLIEYSANVNTAGNNGSSPLMVATWKGHHDIVKALLDANADTNASNLNGETVLHNAAAFNRPNIARLLLEKGVDILAKDKWGLTAEELATKQRNPEVARIIRNSVNRRFQHAPSHSRVFLHAPSQN